MKTAKRTLALLLTVCLLCSTLFTSAFAAEGDDESVNPASGSGVVGADGTGDTGNAGDDKKSDADDLSNEVILEEGDDDEIAPLAEDTTVAKIGETPYEDLDTAIAQAESGQTITICKNVELKKTYTVPAGVTVTSEAGVKLIASSNGQNFVLSEGAKLDGLTIESTVTSGEQCIVQMRGNTTVTNCTFSGTYKDGDNTVTRAMVPNAGVTNITITNNKISNLRQPAYMEAASGTISGNNVTGTRGWVVTSNAGVTFEDNTFGSNAVDIAVIANNNDTNNYRILSELSKKNDGAVIENQIDKTFAEDGVWIVNDKADFAKTIELAQSGDTIRLTSNVEVGDNGATKDSGALNINKDLVVDGGNHTLTASNDFTTSTTVHMINVVNGADVTIKNLTIDSDKKAQHGVNVYTAKDGEQAKVTLENVKILDSRGYGVVSNGSNLTVTGIETSGNYWGGINIDNASGANGKSSFTMESGTIGETASVVIENTNKGSVTATIEDGTLHNAILQNVESGVKLAVEGGTFSGKVAEVTKNGNSLVEKTDLSKMIIVSGGTFGSSVPDIYCAPGLEPSIDENGKHTVGSLDVSKAVASVTSGETVKYYETFAEAVAAANKGDTVALLKNDTVTSVLYVNEGITLDLQKNTITLKASIVFNHGSSELKNGIIIDERSKNNENGSYAAVFVQNSDTELTTSEVTIKAYQPSIKTYNYDLYIKAGATVTLGSGTVIGELPKTSDDAETYGVVGIVVLGTSGNNPQYTSTSNLMIEDGVIVETTGFALSTNGESHGTNITITGGTLTSKGSTGIYFPSNGTLTVSGGTITGVTGIEVRAGEVEVSGNAKIIGTGTPLESDPNGNGTTTTGAGIAVVQHTTKLDTKLTVTGGEISGYHAIYENNLQNNPENDLEKVVISIEDGDFKSTSEENIPISVADKKKFVKGGNFSNSIDEGTDYLSPDLTAELKKASGDVPFSYYPSVEKALKDAESGDTITNLKPDDNGAAIKSYTATFDAGNGTTSLKNITVPSGTKITLPSASRSGYKFRGWYDGSSFAGYDGAEYTVSKDVTLTADWKKNSSGGNSSSTSSSTSIDLDTGKNGDVSISPKKPGKGDKVTITVEPDDGYILDSIKVTDEDGDKIKLTEKGENKFTFTMPSGEVTIETTFTKDGGEDAPKFSFIDVSTGDWFAPAVDYVSAKGMMNGSNGYFSPYDSLTRGMIAQILYNLEGGTGSFAIAYPDVSGSDWYANAVSWVSANGIMSGYGSGLFGANDSVTREQLALTLYSYAKVKGYSTTASVELTAFADGASTSEWAKPAMQWAVANGLFSGKTGNRLDPQGTATRAEVASILMRFCETIAK